MSEERWDAVIAGCGLAGLSLAYALSTLRKDTFRILLLDTERRSGRDHTWCFWEEGAGPWDTEIAWEWNQIQVGLAGNLKDYALEKYRYKILESDRFYDFVWSTLDQDPRFEFRAAQVSEVKQSDLGTGVVKTEDGNVYEASQVFNSIWGARDSVSIWQHFHGWEVQTDKPVFDSGVATLMDFQPDEDGEVRFLYVLPKSAHEALVEYTVFGPEVWDEDAYVQKLFDYLRTDLEAGSWIVKHEETGAIPMSTRFSEYKKSRKCIYNLGTLGGAVKPSTGYAFSRIQRESKWIAEKWVQGRRLQAMSESRLYQSCDATLLELMREGDFVLSAYFDSLFRRWGGDQVLGFLDEQLSLGDVLQIMYHSPWKKFIPAWFRANVTSRSARA
ncbi:MAG: lycopene cyclase family protein [Opitutales bacterium]